MNDKNAVKRGLGGILIGTGILVVSIGIWGANPPEPFFTGLPLVCTLLWAFGIVTFVRGLNGWDFWAWLFSEKDEKHETGRLRRRFRS